MRRFGALFAGMLMAGLLTTGAEAAEAEERHKEDRRGEAVGPVGKGIYSKPFWRRFGKGTYVGGYVDFDFQAAQGSHRRFRQQRLIPFIYSDIAPGLRFATEIEFENGGVKDEADVAVSTTTGSGTAELSGESKVEFAVLDYELAGEALGFRGGLLLSPVGKLNLIHDSPIQDLTDRPLVDRTLIPTTLSEPGAGFFGTVYAHDQVKIDYEGYAVNGFNGGADGTKITKAKGLRDARGSASSDNNDAVAGVGRLAVSPALGQEVGFSFHVGPYDNGGQNLLRVLALDWGFKRGPVEFLGEYAHAHVSKDASIDPSVPENLQGYYAQVNVHFLQDVVRQGSAFTGVVRWDYANTDLRDSANDRERLTVGLNFRPIEETVFKFDYQFNFEDLDRTRVANDAFLFSFATYF